MAPGMIDIALADRVEELEIELPEDACEANVHFCFCETGNEEQLGVV